MIAILVVLFINSLFLIRVHRSIDRHGKLETSWFRKSNVYKLWYQHSKLFYLNPEKSREFSRKTRI